MMYVHRKQSVCKGYAVTLTFKNMSKARMLGRLGKLDNHLRVLKGPDQDSYIIAIKMNSKQSAIDFVSTFHGKRYNFIEPEECRLSIL